MCGSTVPGRFGGAWQELHGAVPRAAPSDPQAEPGFLGTEPASLPLSSARCQNSPGLTPLALLELVLQDGAEQGQSPAGHTQPGRGGQPRSRQPQSSSPPGSVLGAWPAWHAVRTPHLAQMCSLTSGGN